MKIPVQNNTDQIMYVGGVMIPTGESREIEEHAVPEHLRPQAAEAETEAAEPDPLSELLGHSVKDLAEMLPGIEDAALEALEAAELGAAKPRKRLLELLQKERLERAAKRSEGAAKDEGKE